ncbi:MAG TPA: N-acetylmuramoyl-L-alanine amidase [Desulfobacterales bacterium]|nr:N-acetylmuramoyl-L-alanine amidase [Desulfobacterales bacterium]
MTNLCIAIDPGHGGEDPGAVGKTGVQEKVVALAVALRVAAILRPIADVKMTRVDDTDVSLENRANVEADAFISIHCNASVFRDSNGTETFYHPVSVIGRRLAERIQAKVVSALGTRDRGVKKSPNLAVLRLTKCPAALVEIAFLSNVKEEAMLEEPKIHALAAQSIAEGIAEAMGFKLPVVWDPVAEIEKLRAEGLINGEKKPKDTVTWGEFATVLNRLRGKS